jgi:hypothetical protein
VLGRLVVVTLDRRHETTQADLLRRPAVDVLVDVGIPEVHRAGTLAVTVARVAIGDAGQALAPQDAPELVGVDLRDGFALGETLHQDVDVGPADDPCTHVLPPQAVVCGT